MEERIEKLESEVKSLYAVTAMLIRKVDPEGHKIAEAMSNGDMSGFVDKIKEVLEKKLSGSDKPDTNPKKRW